MRTAMLSRNPRGFMGAPMANGDLAGLSEFRSVFAAFKDETATMSAEIKSLTNGMDDLAQQMAALKLGGNGGPVFSRKDLAPFAAFVSKGQVQSSMTAGSGPDGGYMIPDNVDSVIQQQLISLSPLRSYARIVTLGRGAGDYSFNLNRRGTTSGWVGETDSRPETGTPKLANITPSEGELYANPKVSQWLLDDAGFNVEEFLQENVSDEFATQEGVAFVSGDGVKKPIG